MANEYKILNYHKKANFCDSKNYVPENCDITPEKRDNIPE